MHLAEKIELVLEGPGVADRLRGRRWPEPRGSTGRTLSIAWPRRSRGWSIPRRARAAGGRPSSQGSPSSPRRRPVPRPRRAVERLAEGLLDTYAIDIYHESSHVPPIGLRSDRVGCFHHAAFDRNATYKQYRAVLCHLGNAPEYGFVLDFLETHRAIAVLQDFGLARSSSIGLLARRRRGVPRRGAVLLRQSRRGPAPGDRPARRRS